jgi:hypothetical protein
MSARPAQSRPWHTGCPAVQLAEQYQLRPLCYLCGAQPVLECSWLARAGDRPGRRGVSILEGETGSLPVRPDRGDHGTATRSSPLEANASRPNPSEATDV